nr:hypothetical protein [Nocardia nova]
MSDDFNRTDSTSLGANYTVIGGNSPVIATNRAQAGSPAFNASLAYIAVHNTALLTDTQEIAWTVIAAASGSSPTRGGGCLLRGTIAGDFVAASLTNTQAFINTYISGTWATRATLSISTPTTARFTAIGNVYTLYVSGSGTAAGSWTDTGGVIEVGPDARHVGVFSNAANGGVVGRGYAIDDFIARDI